MLLNQRYKPIWQRFRGRTLAADPGEWVLFIRQEWFYNDGNTPWRDQDSRARSEAILRRWGVSAG